MLFLAAFGRARFRDLMPNHVFSACSHLPGFSMGLLRSPQGEASGGGGGGIAGDTVCDALRSPHVGTVLPLMMAPLSGAEPVNPSVILRMTTPEFLGVVPLASMGVKLSVTSVNELDPSVTAVVQGLDTVILSFCIRRVVPLKIGVVFGSRFFADARLE